MMLPTLPIVDGYPAILRTWLHSLSLSCLSVIFFVYSSRIMGISRFKAVLKGRVTLKGEAGL